MPQRTQGRIIHKFSQITTNQICADVCRFVEPILKLCELSVSLNRYHVRRRRVSPPYQLDPSTLEIPTKNSKTRRKSLCQIMHMHIFDRLSSENCTFLTAFWSYYVHFCMQFIVVALQMQDKITNQKLRTFQIFLKPLKNIHCSPSPSPSPLAFT